MFTCRSSWRTTLTKIMTCPTTFCLDHLASRRRVKLEVLSCQIVAFRGVGHNVHGGWGHDLSWVYVQADQFLQVGGSWGIFFMDWGRKRGHEEVKCFQGVILDWFPLLHLRPLIERVSPSEVISGRIRLHKVAFRLFLIVLEMFWELKQFTLKFLPSNCASVGVIGWLWSLVYMHVSYRAAAHLTGILQLVWHRHSYIASPLITSTTICCVSSSSFKSAISFNIDSVLPRLLMQLLLNFDYHLLAVRSPSLWRLTTSILRYRLSNSFLKVFSMLDADQSLGDIFLHLLSWVVHQSWACCALLLSVTVIDCLHRIVLWT